MNIAETLALIVDSEEERRVKRRSIALKGSSKNKETGEKRKERREERRVKRREGLTIWFL
jgi:hypothetical protein